MTTATSIAPSLAPALCPAKVAICKSRVGTKTFELRVIWFYLYKYKYLYSPPSDLSVCEGARKFANQMPIAHISRMVEQFEVRMTKSYFQLPT